MINFDTVNKENKSRSSENLSHTKPTDREKSERDRC